MLSGARLSETAASYYVDHADELFGQYESVSFEAIHADLIPFLPSRPGAALDIGAGSGRDAAWLASHGWSVVAVEPSPILRERGRRRHASRPVEWLDDALPELHRTRELRRTFDLLLLSAVWMHVAPSAQSAAFGALAGLANPEALVAISVRSGGNARRGFFETDIASLVAEASRQRFRIVSDTHSRDILGRPEVTWRRVLLRAPS